jgi:hypothetical protein
MDQTAKLVLFTSMSPPAVTGERESAPEKQSGFGIRVGRSDLFSKYSIFV